MNILPTCKQCGRKTAPFITLCDSCQADNRRNELEEAQRLEDKRIREAQQKLREEEIAEADRKKQATLRNPLPSTLLRLIDGNTKLEKRYTATQIKSLFSAATLSAEAQFEHPLYPGEWHSCIELFDTFSNNPSSVAWDYYVQHLKISGASSGIISAFTDKGLKDDSSDALGRLGAEGWELVAVVPVTTGTTGATWSNSAIAFLKRRRG